MTYPKIRPDVYLTPVDVGVRIMIDGRGHTLKGSSLLPLIERLLPHLTGRQSLNELCDPLEAPQAHTVRRLVQLLQDIGAVRDHAANQGVHPDPADVHLYGTSLAYLETRADAADRRFVGLRDRRVVIVGAGAAVRTLAPALWESGVRLGTVLTDSSCAAVLIPQLKIHQAEDPRTDWQISVASPSGYPHPQEEAVARADLVIAVGERTQVLAVAALIRPSVQAFLPVLLDGATCLIGPLAHPGRPGCLHCVLERLPAPQPGGEQAAYSLSGARAAVEAFHALASLSSAADGAIIAINTAQLTDTHHPVLPSAQCPRCAALPAPEYTGEAPIGLVDPLTGLLAQVEPQDLAQLPLCMWVAETPTRHRVAGAGRSPGDARKRALLSGLRSTLPAGPDGQPPVVATSHQEWLGMAVLEQAQRSTAPDHPLSRSELDRWLDQEAAVWWKTLQLRDGLQPAATLGWHQSTSIPVIALWSGSRHLCQAAGRTPAEALKTALLLAVAAAQLSAETPAQPIDTMAFTEGPVVPEPSGDVPDWSTFLLDIGPLLSTPLPESPLQSAGLFAGWVNLGAPQSRTEPADAAAS